MIPPTAHTRPSTTRTRRRRDRQLFDWVAGLMSVFSLVIVLPALIDGIGLDGPGPWIAVGFAVAFGLLPLAARKLGSPRLPSHALLVLTAGAIVLASMITDSFAGPAAWLVALPLAASVLLSPRATPIWTLIAVALLAAVATLRGGDEPGTIIVLGALVIFVGILAARFERVQRTATQAVQESLDHLVNTQQERVREGTLAAVGELAGGAAHELNNALCGVLPAAQMIAAELDRAGESQSGVHRDVALARARQRIDSVQESAQKAADIVGALMWFAGSTEESVQDTDLTAITRSSLTLCRERITRNGSTLIVELPEAMPCRGVPQDLAQIVLNVLDNARRASEPGGEVRVVGERKGSEIVLQIGDNGPGMSTEVKERAFEPFFTTRTVGEGRGLGLAVAYGIARQHGGDLTIDTEEGEGTTVRLSLPERALID